MIELISRGDDWVRLYFSRREERDLFLSGMGGMEGVEGVEYKENTRTLLIRYRKGSFAEYVLNHFKTSKSQEMVDRQDLHFYISPFIKHPVVKLLFSMAMLGGVAGLIAYGVCSMFLVPYLKNKL
ncbi:MAG: hypothetical protein D6674_06410 [Acidobacteria bacterium]|jgi:hypothetical protein|nr:MAG: hypothetical protein D6674_06410 [Acidobacteriota bacterium]